MILLILTKQSRSLKCKSGNFSRDFFKILLDSGYDINTRFEEGITPLRSAAHHGHFEIVKMLVSQ
ncbi:hypothetical protein C7H19_09030 [Aphanothece hegewaldii CCALA 016]|uniref:Uncharacterized protein n=1 Tax=Aphanothece hegewaldii CCALA 016 TaxID=2107694 RepID=A0A2T1LZ62_9CHRO|nr:hypothetical protein C7H19_09030 [Aphanothece hegewaldii CCALA 016]